MYFKCIWCYILWSISSPCAVSLPNLLLWPMLWSGKTPWCFSPKKAWCVRLGTWCQGQGKCFIFLEASRPGKKISLLKRRNFGNFGSGSQGSLTYSHSKVSWLLPSLHMGVSLDGGTPKSSILTGFSIINHPYWGTTILGKPHIGLYWPFTNFHPPKLVSAMPIYLWTLRCPKLFWRKFPMTEHPSVNFRNTTGGGSEKKQKLQNTIGVIKFGTHIFWGGIKLDASWCMVRNLKDFSENDYM